jgi:hypothetical protein
MPSCDKLVDNGVEMTEMNFEQAEKNRLAIVCFCQDAGSIKSHLSVSGSRNSDR